MTIAREQILKTTCDLMEKQGYHGTGLNEIVKESGSPKGSLYHYFPDGKEQIVAEAVVVRYCLQGRMAIRPCSGRRGD